MKRRVPVLTALVLVSFFVTFTAEGHDFGINTSGPVNDCSDVSFRIDRGTAVAGEQRLQVGGRVLALRLGESSGVPLKVEGGDRSGYELLLCKGASSAADLGAIRLEQRGGEVTVVGPDSRDWGAYLIVRAPRDAQLDVQANNGPVSIATIAGRLDLKASNGPVSLKNVGGAITVDAQNGPVSFSGRSGEVKLNAKNGPMTIHLEGTSWESGQLDASTKNGPLSLRVPANYGSGVAVDKRAHTPFRCATALCGDRVSGLGDRDETVEFGPQPRRVHVATENGPVTISETKN